MANRYQLIRPIARGGMAEVALAEMTAEAGFRKQVALKRVPAALAQDEELVAMLSDEARLAARLHHPNIVQVFDFGRDAQGWYLAMEFVDGCDLARVLRVIRREHRRGCEAALVEVLIQVLRGLDHAHRTTDDAGRLLGVVHRDVSPSNVLISSDGGVKVTDFGIAMARNRIAQTQVGGLRGKVPYMSPEQARSKAVDPRSDVFSAGLVLWECFGGRRAYTQQNEAEALRMAAFGQVADIRTVRPDVPDEIAAILQRALSVEAVQRYGSAGDMASALERWHRQTYPQATRDQLVRLVQESIASPRGDVSWTAEDSPEDPKTADVTSPVTGSDGLPERLGPDGRPLKVAPLVPLAPEAEPPDAMPQGGPLRRARPSLEVQQVAEEPAQGRSGNFRRPRSEVGDETKRRYDGPSVGEAASAAIRKAAAEEAEAKRLAREAAAPKKKEKGISPFVLAGVVFLVSCGVLGVLLSVNKGELVEANAMPMQAPDPVPLERKPPIGINGNGMAEPAPERPAPTREAKDDTATRGATTGKGKSSDTGGEGTLSIQCEPWCEVEIDGKATGRRSPIADLPVRSGSRRIKASNPLLNLSHTYTVEVPDGQHVKRRFNLVLDR